MTWRNNKQLIILILTLYLVGIFCFLLTGEPALASDSDDETLGVDAAWIEGDMLRINVTDAQGEKSALALNLSDYVDNTENKEYIIIQAVDTEGNKSGIVQIKNPNYLAEPEPESESESTPAQPESKPGEHETLEPMPAVIPPMPTDGNPLTPDGSGTVMDYATETDGKEFFTISTEDGSEFFLIVDRQRNTDNVYFLNTVTIEDLVSLAQSKGTTINIAPVQEPLDSGNEENPPGYEPKPEPEPKPNSKNSSGYIFIAIIALAAVGAGYYFKIYKKDNDFYEDEDEDEGLKSDDNEDYGDIDYSDYDSDLRDGGDGK